jgi:hypothetical protein
MATAASVGAGSARAATGRTAAASFAEPLPPPFVQPVSDGSTHPGATAARTTPPRWNDTRVK